MLNKFYNSRSFVLLVILTFVFSVSTAKAADNASVKELSSRQYATVINNLKQKLTADLVTNRIELQINTISESRVSANQIKLAGNAFCELNSDNHQLPMEFAVVVNDFNGETSDISYKFTELEESAASSDVNQVLMEKIMTQIHHDYKTDNIVINIDNFENADADNKLVFTGQGEVRIGDLAWQKIDFQLTMDKDNKAEKIIYKLK